MAAAMSYEQPWLNLDGIPRFSVYDGREYVAVVERRKDGWHVFVRDRRIGVCADRKSALRLVNTTINPNGNSKGPLS
jgi:hypothetical protein